MDSEAVQGCQTRLRVSNTEQTCGFQVSDVDQPKGAAADVNENTSLPPLMTFSPLLPRESRKRSVKRQPQRRGPRA